MWGNILGLIFLVFLVVLMGWLTYRAWRIKRIFFRWVSIILSGLVTLLFAIITIFAGRGLYILYKPQPVLPVNIAITSSPEKLARGEHLASSLCAACHSLTGELPLTGGKNLSADIGLPLGDLYAPNLTPAGPVKGLSDADIWRIFRQGVFPNGRQVMMPVNHLQKLSDDDLQAIITYVRSQPAEAYSTPPTNPSLLLSILLGTGLYNVQVSPVTEAVTAPAKGATVEFGAYIVSYNDCTECHGKNLDGATSGPIPPGPNLRVVQGWTEEQFIATLRTGVDPYKHELRPPMAWKTYGKMDDEELQAVYLYLKSLPPATVQK